MVWRLWMLALVLPLLIGKADAEKRTPGSRQAVNFQPYGQDPQLTTLGEWPGYAEAAGGYLIEDCVQSSPSYVPAVTLADFVSQLQAKPGVWFTTTHSDGWYLSVEVYPHDDVGGEKCLDAAMTYYNDGYDVAFYEDVHGTGYSVSISATDIGRFADSTACALVDLEACRTGVGIINKFKPLFGLACTWDGTSAGDVQTFWGRLQGQGTFEQRYAGSAASGLITSHTAIGNCQTVLFPAQEAYSHADSTEVDLGTDMWVRFNAAMDATQLPMRETGNVSILTQRWSDPYTCSFRVAGIRRGVGHVYPDSNWTASAYSDIKLWGGRWSNPLTLKSTHNNNGAAEVNGLRVVDGVLSFTAIEAGTAGYRVDAGESPAGSFRELLTVPSQGGGNYRITIPGSPCYRLVELETTGRERVLGYVEPTSPVPTPPDTGLSEAVLRQRVQDLCRLANGLLPEQIEPAQNVAVFTREAWINDLQPALQSVWGPQGYSFIFLARESYPSEPWLARQAIEQDVNTLFHNQGIRDVQFVGGSSNHVQFNDSVSVYYPTSEWLNIHDQYVAAGYVSDPGRDIIPTWYVLDSRPRDEGQPYFDPYIPTDDPYRGGKPIRIARASVSTATEMLAWLVKTLQYELESQSSRNIGFWVNDWSLFGNSGEYVRKTVEDSLLPVVPSTYSTEPIYARDLPNGAFLSGRTAAVVNQVLSGVRDVVVLSTLSNQWRPGDWVDTGEGFRISQFGYGPFLMIGGTCEVAGANRGFPTSYGSSFTELALSTPDAGPVAVAGFRTGTFQAGIGSFLRIYLMIHCGYPDQAWSETCRQAVEQATAVLPGYATMYRSFGLEGFVLSRHRSAHIPTDLAGRSFRTWLSPAWPNPFHTGTEFRYSLAQAGLMRLEIYDAAGRLVSRLVGGRQESGRWHRVIWSGTDRNGQPVPGGVYFVRLLAGSGRATRKVVMVR